MASFAASEPIASSGGYPAGVDIDPPERQSRLSVLFRIILILPHAIILAFLGIAVAVVTLIAWFAILFTGRHPVGLYNFVVNVTHWQVRYTAYSYFLTGKYPPFASSADSTYPARFWITPQYEGRNRLTVFFRIFMLIPHIIVLYFVNIVASVLLLVAWIVGTFTGLVPEGIHNFLVGFVRWSTRVGVYNSLLTDEYPPFALK